MRKLLLALLLIGCGGSPPKASLDVKGGQLDQKPGPEPCTAGELLCDGDKVAKCGADGTTREPVLDCSVNATQTTCGSCATGPACLSPKPLCTGNIDGWSFSTSGCGELQCEPSITTSGGKRSLRLIIDGVKPMSLVLGNLNLVTQGANAGPFGVAANAHLTVRGCYPYDPTLHASPPPSSDNLRVSWTGTNVGDTLTVDVDAYLDCAQGDGVWKHFVAHTEVVLQ